MSRFVTRRAVLASVGASGLAGCLDGAGSGGGTTPTETASDESPGATPTTNGGGSTADGPPTAEGVLPLPMEASAIEDQAVSGGVTMIGAVMRVCSKTSQNRHNRLYQSSYAVSALRYSIIRSWAAARGLWIRTIPASPSPSSSHVFGSEDD